MGKILGIFVVLLSIMAESVMACNAANRTCISQRNAANTNTMAIAVPVPVSDAIYFFELSTLTPKAATLGANCSIVAGVLNCSGGGVNADWNAVSGAAEILNKPTLFSGTYSSLTGIPSDFTPTAHTHAWADIVSGKPTTLSGYGISDGSTTAALTAGLATKFNSPSGTTAQYLRGDGSLATLPTPSTVGSPASRSVSLSTAYQCTDNTKSCTVTATMTCPLTLSLLAGATCSGEVRIGSANTVASGGGTNIAPIQRNASGILGLSTNDYETKTIRIPIGWYFAIRQTAGAGMTVISVFDQAE